MWDALNDDARQLVLDAARIDADSVVLCKKLPSHITMTPVAKLMVVDGLWSDDRDQFYGTLDLDSLPVADDVSRSAVSEQEWQAIRGRVYRMRPRALCVPIWNKRGIQWLRIGFCFSQSHRVHGAFHGVQKAFTETVRTNCVLDAETSHTMLCTARKLLELEALRLRLCDAFELQLTRLSSKVFGEAKSANADDEAELV